MKLRNNKNKPYKEITAGRSTYKLWHNDKDLMVTRVEMCVQDEAGFKIEFPATMNTTAVLATAILQESKDVLESFGLVMYSISALSLTDTTFMGSIIQELNIWQLRQDGIAQEEAENISEEDEILSQAFMESLTEPIDPDKEKRLAQMRKLMEDE